MSLNGTDSLPLLDDLDWTAVRVASFIPGRVRLKSPQLRSDASLGPRIAEALGDVRAVTDVSVNARTGSVLVHYDEDQLEDLPSLLDRAESLGLVPDGADLSRLKSTVSARRNGTTARRDFSAEVRSVFRSMNRSVDTATGGALDLKGLLPLSLVGMGTYRLLRGTATQPLPWFNYFWFAFSIFVATGAGRSDDAADGSGAASTAAADEERAAAAT
jgi:hypothetical protein